MAKYLVEASYTVEGVKGVQSAGGSSRRDAIAALAESVGGQLESFYFAFGERDVYTVVDLPDNEAATAIALTVNASGAVTVRTSVLLTPEEVDAAAQRSVDYRPPGACQRGQYPDPPVKNAVVSASGWTGPDPRRRSWPATIASVQPLKRMSSTSRHAPRGGAAVTREAPRAL